MCACPTASWVYVPSESLRHANALILANEFSMASPIHPSTLLRGGEEEEERIVLMHFDASVCVDGWMDGRETGANGNRKREK